MLAQRFCLSPELLLHRQAVPAFSRCGQACSTSGRHISDGDSAPAIRPAPRHRGRACTRLHAVKPTNPPAQPLDVRIPQSQEEAVQHAAEALKAHVQQRLGAAVKVKKPSKGFAKAVRKGPGGVLGVEIPAADQSPAAVVTLAVSVAASLAAELRAGGALLPAVTLVCTDAAGVAPGQAALLAAQRASKSALPAGTACKCLLLEEACRQDSLGGLLMLAAPKVEDVALVEQLLVEVWSGPAAVLLNSEFPQRAVPEQYRPIAEAVQMVYCFMPVSVQGLLGNKEGAVMRVAPSPDAADSTWRILVSNQGAKGELSLVGQTKRRPSTQELELAFINASASASPLTKGVKFLKGLVPGQK